MNQVLSRYKSAARIGGRRFALSRAYFRNLIQSDCVYCGSTPRLTKLKCGEFSVNGIDRVDNTKGYILGNVVPCCKQCNWLKKALTVENWELLQQHFEKIVAHRARQRCKSKSEIENLCRTVVNEEAVGKDIAADQGLNALVQKF